MSSQKTKLKRLLSQKTRAHPYHRTPTKNSHSTPTNSQQLQLQEIAYQQYLLQTLSQLAAESEEYAALDILSLAEEQYAEDAEMKRLFELHEKEEEERIMDLLSLME